MKNNSIYLKKNELEEYCIYECDARNFSVGVWINEKMYGLRTKFTDTFLDYEIHFDDDPKYGTCKPLKKISNSLETKFKPLFELKNSIGTSIIEYMLYTAVNIVNFNKDKDE